ncbi:hypothetical protein DENSPDRAFT_643460 [Dentipellis sp. KUC8613]|nr:hypothetical protein DENSPDRAFT_643460 [Dentipellis sp. KUC8613]
MNRREPVTVVLAILAYPHLPIISMNISEGLQNIFSAYIVLPLPIYINYYTFTDSSNCASLPCITHLPPCRHSFYLSHLHLHRSGTGFLDTMDCVISGCGD